MLLALIFGIPLGLLDCIICRSFVWQSYSFFLYHRYCYPCFWLTILLAFSAIQNWEISAIGQYNLLYEIKPITGFPIIDVWFTDQPYQY